METSACRLTPIPTSSPFQGEGVNDATALNLAYLTTFSVLGKRFFTTLTEASPLGYTVV